MSTCRRLQCVRVYVTGETYCAPPVPMWPPSSLQEPALSFVCGMWQSLRINSLTWNSDRFVCPNVCMLLKCNSIVDNLFATHTHALILTPLSFTAVIWSYGCSGVSRCVWGPQHNSERLSWPHLYPVGLGRAKLYHSVSRTHNHRLCTGYQWSNCKSTFWVPFFPLLCLSCSFPPVLWIFWLTVITLFLFTHLAAWGREGSHC